VYSAVPRRISCERCTEAFTIGTVPTTTAAKPGLASDLVANAADWLAEDAVETGRFAGE
jgi:hypothetical protein